MQPEPGRRASVPREPVASRQAGTEPLPAQAASPLLRLPLSRLLAVFTRLGTLTFGGGVQSWVHREVVDRLHWLDHPSFLSGLTLSQMLPGANPVNISLFVGFKLRGGRGAAVAVVGMVVPALAVTLLLGALYRLYGQLALVHFLLLGLAAAGVGAMLTMGVKLARRMPRDLVAALAALAVFICVGVLRWPLLPVIAVAAPISVAAAFIRARSPAAAGSAPP